NSKFPLRSLNVFLIGPWIEAWFRRIAYHPPALSQIGTRRAAAQRQFKYRPELRRQIPIVLEGIRFHTKKPSLVFPDGITVPLHDCRKPRMAGAGSNWPSVEDHWLTSWSPG